MKNETISNGDEEIKSSAKRFQEWAKFLISSRSALFPPLLSVSKRGFPMLQQSRWPYPDLDCSDRAQSCRYRFDEAPLFVRGLADSIFWLSDAVARPRQRHLKILNDGDAFHKRCNEQRLHSHKNIFLRLTKEPSHSFSTQQN